VEYASGEENTMLVPKYVLIATGSKPRSLPNLEFDEQDILSSDGALNIERLPSSIVIIGGGVIGIEWASLLVDLGVEVTVVEYEPHILMTEDDDIRKEVDKQLKKRGVNILTNTTLDTKSVKVNDDEVTMSITLDDETKTLTAEKLLISVGREANTSDIGLQN